LENIDERLVEFFSQDKPFAEAFKCLFENASEAIYVLDKKGNFVLVNHKAEELTGFSREDFIGKSFRKIIPIKSLPKAIRGFLDVIKGKKIRLELETQNKPKITVDVEKMKRVFTNIIKNAIDAMPKSGKLKIKSKEKDGDLEIAFADTGIGMLKEVQEKIWTPFFTTKARGLE